MTARTYLFSALHDLKLEFHGGNHEDGYRVDMALTNLMGPDVLLSLEVINDKLWLHVYTDYSEDFPPKHSILLNEVYPFICTFTPQE